jgi:hypothetical protein
MLPMQVDPILEWKRLTESYRRMNDDELRDLAADFANLTVTAQQVLRSEMQSRRLGDPQAVSTANESPVARTQPANCQPRNGRRAPQALLSPSVTRKNYDLLAGPLVNSYVVPTEPEEDGAADDSPCDYLWKTMLCECGDVAEARQLSIALARAGIECWIEAMPPHSIGIGNLRVLVAADQLDQARAIAAQPIPQEVVSEATMTAPDFTLPQCPMCGAKDPILEGLDP